MANEADFIRPVPQIMPGAALTVSTGKPICSLSFPAAGGIQGIDALGAVLPLSSATGSLIPAADNQDDLGTALLEWKYLFVGTKIFAPAIEAAGPLPFTNLDLTLTAAGTGVIALTSPETITPVAAASGTQTALTVTGAANLAQTTTLEVPDVSFNLARTVTWAAGDITAQRAIKINAPTYVVSGGASTITTASTMSLSGAPVAGATTILARSYSLFVESGVTNLAGGVGLSTGSVAGGDNNAVAVCLTVRRLVDSAASGVAGVGANGVGGALSFEAPNDAGTQTLSGLILSKLTTVTAGAEVAELSLGGAFAGSDCEALRLLAVTGAVVNRIDITPSVNGSPVLFAARGSANVSLSIFGTGTGGVAIRNSGDTSTVFGVQSVASGNYAPTMWASNESDTPGAAVINRPSGQVAVAIGAASVTVTNDLVTATSVVIATLQFIDDTFTQILSVVPGAGSFVITGNAVATAATKIGFIVINPST